MAEEIKNPKFEKIIRNDPRKAIKNAIRSLEDLEEKPEESLGIMGVSSLIDYSAHMGYITPEEAEIYRQEAD